MHFDYNQFPGNSLFWEILNTYIQWMDTPVRFMLIGFVLVMLYFCAKGTTKEKCFYGVYFVVLVVVCLNPWMARYLIDKWGFFERYFRFFWLRPVSMGYAYFLVKLYDKGNKKSRWALYVIVAMLFVFSCSMLVQKTKFVDIYTGDEVNTGMIPVDNVYKVEDDLIEASDIIEKYSGNPSALKKTLYDREVFIEIRTYDPALVPAVIYGEFPAYNATAAINENNWYALMCIFYSGNGAEINEEAMNSELLVTTMNNLDCQYVMLYKDNPYYDIWTSSFQSIGDAGRFTVLKIK